MEEAGARSTYSEHADRRDNRAVLLVHDRLVCATRVVCVAAGAGKGASSFS